MYRTFQSCPCVGFNHKTAPDCGSVCSPRTFVLVLIASALMLVFQFGDSEESRAGVAANETMTTGSFIINMGVTPQTTGNGEAIRDDLRPHRNLQLLPVKWVIDPSQTKGCQRLFA